MMKILAAVAAMVGIILIAGTNAALALGLGLVALASYIVATRIMERLERIEHGVDDLRHQAEADGLNQELLRRADVGSQPPEQQSEPGRSS
jgi:hypothetical protein